MIDDRRDRSVRIDDRLGVTVPLITNESGEKLGKSLGNALWLDDNLSTPYECYQVRSSSITT